MLDNGFIFFEMLHFSSGSILLDNQQQLIIIKEYIVYKKEIGVQKHTIYGIINNKTYVLLFMIDNCFY